MTHRDSEYQARADSGLTRRRAVASFGAVGMTGLLAQVVRAQQPAGTPVPAASPAAGQEVNLEATMPDWRFSVVTIQDPYKGTITKPSGVPAGIRVVGYQVVLTNNSNTPMQFSITDIRLRDADGVEYRGGDYIGTEPRLVSQNLPDGERTRGWVWFGIPEGSQTSSVVFIAPAPTLRIRVGQ